MLKLWLWTIIVTVGGVLTAADLLTTPPDEQMPFDTQILEQRTEGKLSFKRFYFTSHKERGKTFRIYAVYAAPVSVTGKVPAILHLHGGGQTADLELAKRWAMEGYACISFDWTGSEGKKMTVGKEYSLFGDLPDDHVARMFPKVIENSALRHLLIGAGRAVAWMSSQPEVDTQRFGVIGLSWGGFSSLLFAEINPQVKAVADVYGCGYYTEPRALTGPLIYSARPIQQAWLEAYDPGVRIKKLKAPVLMVTGTNDMFFPLEQTFKTFQEIPVEKRLIMVPDVNHSLDWKFIDPQVRAWFAHYLRAQNDNLPEFVAMEINNGIIRGRLELHGNQLQKVSMLYSWCEKKARFTDKNRWSERPAELLKDNFMLKVPTIAPTRKTPWLAFYISATASNGLITSSDIHYVKVDKIVTPVKNVFLFANNFFADPSLEKQRDRGYNGKVFFNYTGKYDYDDSGVHARSGKAAVKLSGANQLMMEASGCKPGKKYQLAGYFKGNDKNSSVSLRINWQNNGKFIKTSEFTDKTSPDEYKLIKFQDTAPENTTSAILFYNAENAWLDDLAFILTK